MKTLVLLDKFYRYGKKIDEKYEKYLSRALLQLIKEKTGHYDVDFEYVGLHSSGYRPTIALAGKDEKYVYNFLKKEFGTVYNFSDLSLGKIIRGRMRKPDLVNFGIFIDCGVENPIKDALLPHFALINQLIDGKKVPKKQICKAFGFYKEMPVNVKISKIDKISKKIECEFAEETIEMFNTWINNGFDLLFSTGAPRKQIKKAIKKTKHYPDYLSIERLGFLETVIYLKKGTHAPGILADIGPLLSNTKFSMLQPIKILKLKQK